MNMKRLLTLALTMIGLPLLGQGGTVLGDPIGVTQGPQVTNGYASSNYVMFDAPQLAYLYYPLTGSNSVTFHYTCLTNFPAEWTSFDYLLLHSDDGVSWNQPITVSFSTNSGLLDQSTIVEPKAPYIINIGTNSYWFTNAFTRDIGFKPQYYTVQMKAYTNADLYYDAPQGTLWYNTNCFGCQTPSTNVSGQLLWVTNNTAASGNNVTITGVAVDGGGRSVFTGIADGTNIAFGTNLIGVGTAIGDGFYVNCDNLGSITTSRHYPVNPLNPTGSRAYSVVVDSQSNAIVAGSFFGTIDFGGTILTATSTISGSMPNMFVAKYDQNSSLLWVKQYGSFSSEEAIGIRLFGNDDIGVVGKYQSPSVNFGSGYVLTNAAGSYWSTATLRLDGATGTTLWADPICGGYANVPYAIAIDSHDNVIISGSFHNGYMLKLSGTDGHHLWTNALPGIANSMAIETNTDSIIGCGISNSYIFMRATSSSGAALWSLANYTFDANAEANAVCINGTQLILAGCDAYGVLMGAPTIYFGNGSYNMYIINYTVNGTNVPSWSWTKHLGSGTSGESVAKAAAFDSSGNVRVAGMFQYTTDFGGKSVTVPNGFVWGFNASYNK